jgi:hypothetical protein
VKKISKSLALFTKNELKLCLERENVNFTREQDNKADLVLLLASVLEKKNIDLKTYVKYCIFFEGKKKSATDNHSVKSSLLYLK